MDKLKSALTRNLPVQAALYILFVAVTALSVYVSDKSVFGFLLMLASLLLLYYTSFSNRIKWIVAAVLLILIIPWAASGGPSHESYMEVATQCCIFVAMALGLNIVVGLAGLLDLGFIAFFAVGAYTYAIFSTTQANKFIDGDFFPLPVSAFWIFILIGGFIAVLFGVLLGLPVLRVKGDYLAIVTLGFGEIIRIIFNNLEKPVNITNGAMGISSIQHPSLFGFSFIYPHQIYFIVLSILALVIFGVMRLEHSRLGRAWKAVRENEIAAQSMGIPVIATKLSAFAIGASFSGMMGVVFAAKQTFIDPSSFTLLQSITVLVMVLLGGMGSVPGVIVGACVVTILNMQVLTELTQWLNLWSARAGISFPSALSPAKMQRFIFGIILVGMAVYRPDGLIMARNRSIDPERIKADFPRGAGSLRKAGVESGESLK